MKQTPGVKTKGSASRPSKKTEASRKSQSGSSHQRLWIILPLVFTLVVTWMLYRPALHYGFTNWDDPSYVLENPHVKNLNGESIRYLFSNPSASNYHPLTMISLGIDYKNSPGDKNRPGIVENLDASRFHSTNILLHIINIVLVWLFIYMLAGRRWIMATITAGLFAIHPMHIESVAWIAERKDVLYTMFLLFGLIVYLRYLESKKLIWLIPVFTFYILSLLSKPAAVIFPLILMAVDYYKCRTFNIKTLGEKIPFLLLSVLFGIITVMIQSQDAIAEMKVFTLFQRIMFASYGFIMYIIKLVVPFSISAYYPYPTTIAGGPVPWFYYVTPILVVVLGVAVYLSLRKTRVLLFGLLFYFFSVMLVLQFVSVGTAIMADRYTYLSSVGIFFIIGYFTDRGFTGKTSAWYPVRWLVAGAVACMVLYNIVVSTGQVKVWENSETLWTDVIEKYPSSEVAYKNRGNYYGNSNLTEKALDDYTIYIKLKPDDATAYSNIGNIYGLRNEIEKSLEAYSKSIALDSTDFKTYLNRAITYAKAKQFTASVADYDKALQLLPGAVEVYSNRAYTLLEMGNYEGALQDFTYLIGYFPGNDDFYLSRGSCKYMLKQYDEALADYNTSITLNPRNAAAHFNSSVVLKEQGLKDPAYKMALKAQSLGYQVKPEYLASLKSIQ